jgi:protein-S-isoprenylcysteine O-methyltransferase Ste14
MAPAYDRIVRLLEFAPAFAAGVAVLWTETPAVALVWFAASRLAYVGFVASTLVSRDRRPVEPREQALAAWERFRARAEWLMWNDAVAFSAVVLATRGSLDADPLLCLAAGAALFALGVGVKVWAARSIADGGYFWRDFFVPEETALSARGPYRLLSHPMYTIGYAHVYGIAVAFRSLPALLCGVFAQTTMLLLEAAVEAPHFKRLLAARGEADPRNSAAPSPSKN